MTASENVIRIDAKTFQEPLGKLAATMVEKVFRDGHKHISGPNYVGEDIATMVRYAASVYNLLNYLNADERRKGDCYWFTRYGVTAMSLVRSLIDCLYNVTAILENPTEKAPAYRKSGFKKALADLEEDGEQYAGQPEWELYVQQRRGPVEGLIRASGFTVDEITSLPKSDTWLTFGAYISKRAPGGLLTAHQQFLKTFAHKEWRQYSALSHGAYEAFIGTMGHVPIGVYYMNDFLPHDVRRNVNESYERFLSTHLGRSATVLLCLVTEIQSYCRFEGHRINERICELWSALMPVFEAKELYDGRYSRLMIERGIVATAT